MANKIGFMHPAFAALMKGAAGSFEAVSRGDYESDAAMAAAHPDLRALVVMGGGKMGAAEIDTFPYLGLIACFGVGYDGLDVAHANAKGITCTNCPNTNNEDVADHAVGIFIALLRDIVRGHARVVGPDWSQGERGRLGPSLWQLKAGIVGMGAIGQSIAKRLPAFGIPVSWWGPNAKPDLPYPRATSVLQLAKDNDVLFMAGRADENSRGIISTEVIEAVGPRGYIVNISRGFTVDEDALIAALKAGRLAGAALDVFWEEPTPAARWADVPNVVLTPHVGGGGRGAIEKQAKLVMENLSLFFAGQPLKTPIAA
ncbi:2-ketogluconate reductase [Alphaproteobacteria bacterium SO-S41]|nr:2-ketogluconate reductase [Alphaproteobacteria bacterium SO-S41]